MPLVDSAEFRSLVRDVTVRHPNVGLAVGIVGPDGLTDFVGYGVADLTRGTPITPRIPAFGSPRSARRSPRSR